MTAAMSDRRAGEGGFTLIETVVALALMSLVLYALANITAQWLPNWSRGVGRVQRAEAIGTALQRIAADLAAAEFVPANRDAKHPLFDGSELSITFVRTSVGPNAGPGLEVVHFGEATDRGEFVTVRSSARFAPLPVGSSVSEQVHLGNPVVLLRAPFRLSFAYAGTDRVWKSTWREADRLPAMIKLTVRDAASQRVLSASTIASIHVQVPSDCIRPDGDCGDKPGANAPGTNQPGTNQPGNVAMAGSAAQGGRQ
jgi:general secretion pathway protein J